MHIGFGCVANEGGSDHVYEMGDGTMTISLRGIGDDTGLTDADIAAMQAASTGATGFNPSAGPGLTPTDILSMESAASTTPGGLTPLPTIGPTASQISSEIAAGSIPSAISVGATSVPTVLPGTPGSSQINLPTGQSAWVSSASAAALQQAMAMNPTARLTAVTTMSAMPSWLLPVGIIGLLAVALIPPGGSGRRRNPRRRRNCC